MTGSIVKVLIAARDPLARAGLSNLLSLEPECTVVGQTSLDVDLSSDNETLHPDVEVWDLGWNPTEAVDGLSDFMEGLSSPGEGDPAVLALAPDEASAAEARRAGARGVLLRDAHAPKLVAAAVAVARGLVVTDVELAQDSGPRSPAGGPLAEGLTPRELEVLGLVAEGLPNKSIARRLDISEHTVKFHVNAIMGKLEARSRTEAVTRATRLGLILL